MRLVTRTIVAAVVALSGFLPTAMTAPLARSVSASRQFIVYGPDARLRGAVCDLAERTKKTALALLRERDAWKTPIVIDAQYPEANLPELPPARLNFSQTGSGLKLQLDLRIGADVDAPAVERELLRAIFLEMMYRAMPNTPAGTPYAQPPDWLLDGTLALGQADHSSAATETLATAVESGNVMPLEEFLRQQPGLLESPSRTLYRAYAAALVSMLTDSAAGGQRLARFVAELPRAGNDSAEELKTHFPAFGPSADNLQKAWPLGIARFASSERYRLLGWEETERQLAQLLRVELRDPDQRPVAYSLEEFPRFVRDPSSRGALQALTQQLLVLSGKANPLYRPVIAQYQEIATLLARRKTKRMPERLAKLRETREHIARRMSSIGDYMNWFEATQARSTSGEFQEYLKAAELALEREPRRRDRISVYLDSLEAQLEN